MKKWMMAMLTACAAVAGQAATLGNAFYEYLVGKDGCGDDAHIFVRDIANNSGASIAIPILDVDEGEVIAPVVISGSFDNSDLNVKVVSDQEVFDSLFPKAVWNSRSKWRDEVDDDDEHPYYDFDYGSVWYCIDTSVWPMSASPTTSTRKWIVVSPKNGNWPHAGIRTFYVGYCGGRDYVFVPVSVGLNGCGIQFSDIFRGVTISGTDILHLDFDIQEEVLDGDVGVIDYCFCSDDGEAQPNSIKISVPSAGRLVLAGWHVYEDDGEELKITSSTKNAFSECVDNDDDEWLNPYDSEEYYRYAAAWGTQVRRLDVTKATTLTLSMDSDWIDLSAIHFFPKNNQSVAVDARYASLFPLKIAGIECDNYFQGYVKGTGVYKVGETVSLTAVAFEGESFDHWEVLYGSVPSGTNLKSPTLSFKVTNDMAGDPEDEEQITVRAVWKDRTRISVLPIPVGAATVSGNGSFVDGAQVPVSLTAAEGCTFEYWQDGDSSGLRRTFTANGGDVTAYAVFSGTPSTPPSAVASAYGPYVPGANISVTIADLVGYTAKGLPTGLKFDSKTGTISGTPTKPTGDAGATVTFTKKGAETYATQIIVGALPVLKAEVVGGGKVTGAGAYAANKKVTLKATANKGNVFAGWYADEDGANEGGGRGATAPVSRLASYVLAMPTNDVTLYAKFIPQSEDWAEVACYVEGEYETKQPIDPIAVQVESGSLPTVKVTGLPTGLKFTAKDVVNSKTKEVTAAANTIYGTPTKSGVYTVTVTATTAGKATDSETLTFVVRSGNEKFLKIESDATMGKVTGAGIYAAGKKVTLKATANKGYVFAGWYAEEDGGRGATALPGASDYRTASFVYTMPEDDTVVYARFVYASEDSEIGLWVDDTEVTENAADAVFNISGECCLPLDVESVSVPKVAVSGLPSGLKYTAKQVLNKDKSVAAEANTIYGTATKPGTYVVTAKLTNTTVKKALVRKFTIVVDNLTGANDVLVCTDADGNAVALANARGESYALTVGVSELSLPRKIAATAGAVKVTGLPTGLKYDAKTGVISGIATKAGTYTVYVTVGKLTSTFTVVVEALPDWAVGNFTGRMHLSRPSEQPSGMDYEDWYEDWFYGTATIDVAANGKISGKLVTDEQNVIKLSYASFTATEDGALVVYDETTDTSLILEADMDLVADAAVGRISLERGNLTAELTRNEWKKGGVLAKLAASLKGKTVKKLSNDEPGCEDIIYVMDLSFSADGVVKVKYYDENEPKSSYSASGTLCLVDGDDAGEDELSLLLPLNLVKPDKEYCEVHMTISRDGEILDAELVVPNDELKGDDPVAMLPSNIVGEFWGFIGSCDYKNPDGDEWIGTVLVSVDEREGIEAVVETPKGKDFFSAVAFDSIGSTSYWSYGWREMNEAYKVTMINADGNELQLAFDSSATWTSSTPFGGCFKIKGGSEFCVDGEMRITSWTDNRDAIDLLSDYVGIYNLEVDDEVDDVKWVAKTSDCKLTVKQNGEVTLTGNVDGNVLNATTWLTAEHISEVWCDFTIPIDAKRVLYFEFRLDGKSLNDDLGYCEYRVFN